MVSGESDIIQDAKTFLKQQSELYGSDFILEDPDVLTHVPVATNGCGMSLDEFQVTIQDCQKCELGATRKNFVFGVGNPNANLMLIGEAPGEEEDLKGEPFVGKAGQLLDKILAAIGFNRQEVYIANILKCRPPGNRDPLPEEREVCLPYLLEQIQIIAPRILLLLGKVAAQTLLNSDLTLGQMRSSTHKIQTIPTFVTYHPAALLRNPQWKRPVWEDVQKLRHLYDEVVKDKPKWQPPRTS